MKFISGDRISNQEKSEDLRNRFRKIMLQEPESVVPVAKSIGISLICFHKFLKNSHAQSFLTLYKIEKYIMRREKELMTNDFYE